MIRNTWAAATALGRCEARRIPCASLLLSLTAAVVFVVPSLAGQLQYDRNAIAAGEIWRLFSGHWSHYSFDHLFWDVLAFGFLGMACERRSASRFLVCVAASAFAVSLSVWLCLPGMIAYRGLSGVDSALLALLCVEMWSEGVSSRKPEQIAIAGACLAGFLLKISFELTTGATLLVESLGSGAVGVPLAHVAGAMVGFLVGLGNTDVGGLCYGSHRIRTKLTSSSSGVASPAQTLLFSTSMKTWVAPSPRPKRCSSRRSVGPALSFLP